MSTSLTPIQQNQVTRARRFLASHGDEDQTVAFNFGAALAHLELLLDIIDGLTGGAS